MKDLPFDIYKENGSKLTLQYEEALIWLKGLGLPAFESRLGKYKKIIDNFEGNLKALDDEISAEKTFHEYLNAQMEAAELIRIYRSLSNRDFAEFSEQLKKVTAGQPFRNASKQDPSRDFAFELTVASRFINAGFDVQLNQLADIVAVKNGYPKLFLECKRIKSDKRVQENVKKANEQLKKRIASERSKLCRGIVAINVTEIINPDNDMNVVSNVHELQSVSSTLLEAFVRNNERNLETKKFNKCLGVLVESTMQGYSIENGGHNTINCRGAKLYQYQNQSSDASLVRDIGLLISNQNIVA